MKAAAIVLVLALVACGRPPVVAPVPLPTSPTSSTIVPGAVDVRLDPPARAGWMASTLGPAKPTMRIVVTNATRRAIDVSDLRVHLDAVREGIAFRCAESVGPERGAREPRVLRAGDAYAFERPVDCALPLTGRYAVRVAVSFGDADWREPRPIRSFSLTVGAADHVEPRPLGPAVPGVWAALGASPVIGGESGAGKGRIGVLLVNGAAAPASLPSDLRLGLRVYRAGNPIPCEDDPLPLARGTVLVAGQSVRRSLEVSCLGLHSPGRYEVVGRVLTGDAEVEIGRLSVEISNDPSRRAPPVR